MKKRCDLHFSSLEARLLAPFVNKPFPPVQSDIVFAEDFDLNEFGVDGQVIATPGHTAGSVSIRLSNGEAIVGDLLMGGRLGGAINAGRPGFHYFVADRDQLLTSIGQILAERPARLYVGHGGPPGNRRRGIVVHKGTCLQSEHPTRA